MIYKMFRSKCGIIPSVDYPFNIPNKWIPNYADNISSNKWIPKEWKTDLELTKTNYADNISSNEKYKNKKLLLC